MLSLGCMRQKPPGCHRWVQVLSFEEAKQPNIECLTSPEPRSSSTFAIWVCCLLKVPILGLLRETTSNTTILWGPLKNAHSCNMRFRARNIDISRLDFHTNKIDRQFHEATFGPSASHRHEASLFGFPLVMFFGLPVPSL